MSQIELWKYAEVSDNNTGEAILLDKQTVSQKLLNCDEFISYWLIWDSLDSRRIFRLGFGPELHDLEIFKYEDRDKPYQISSIGFSSEDSKVAKWTFKDNSGNTTLVLS